MAEIGYLRMEEVSGIPQLSKAPGATVYGPLGDMPIEADVVLFWDRPATMMVLQEAAIRAGVAAPHGTAAGGTGAAVMPARRSARGRR
jgi:uncharacterized protein (DUF169 family)